jgi:hypothetical protein
VFRILNFLQIFKHATLFFSRDTPSISTVIPAMDHIDSYLATTIEDPSTSDGLKGALYLGNRTLNRYYDKTDLSEIYRIAMGAFFISRSTTTSTTIHTISIFFLVLHPRHKLKNAGWEEDWIDTAHQMVRDEFDRTYAFMDIAVDDDMSDAKVHLFLFF